MITILTYMKKAIKILFLILGSFVIVVSGILTYFFATTSSTKLDDNKFVNFDRKITYFDDAGSVFLTQSNGLSIVDSASIPSHTKNAFIAIEDKRFYSHNGIDVKRLMGATLKNVKSLSIKEGGSTITQQLIKNTHLSSEKTLKRKLNEIKLSLKLERKYSKDEILEKYLNTIYFGDNCYGILEASKHYFDKAPKDLSINESAILASIIKSPANYSPKRKVENCFKRKNVVLKAMYEQKFIDKFTYEKCIKEQVLTANSGEKYGYDISHFTADKISNLIENAPYSINDLKIYTTLNRSAQNILENSISDIGYDLEKSAILMDKNGQIMAYTSTCADINRQLGSALKPLAVYAPAIEKNLINSFTIISDEKTDFNGYSPSNYNDRYYGNISVKESLEKSSNTVAVKILNYLGAKTSINYLEKMNFNAMENDANLSLALGSTTKGDKLSTLTAGYSVFINGGNYNNPNAINKIVFNNKSINNKSTSKKVFSNDTAYIVCDMLKGVVQNGTAKKLSSLPFSVYAKTGTVGDKNGNSDAYCISFTKEYILGVRLSAKQGKKLDNSITGGGLPASISKTIWENLYKHKAYPTEIEMPQNVKKIMIDKIAFEENNKIVLADNLAPKRYVKEVLCKENNIPNEKSTRFSFPKMEKPKLSIENNQITIRLCVIEYYNVVIFRSLNNKNELVYDTKDNNKEVFIDASAEPDKIYDYYAVPYYMDNENKKHFGEKIYIGTIKSPRINLGDWWDLDI